MRTEKNATGQIAFAVGLLAGSFATFLLTSSRKNKQSDASQHPSSAQINNNNSQNAAAAAAAAAQSTQTMPDEIRSEMLSRNSLYFASSNGMPDITNSCVLVVGLGGVGSHTAHMLARSGVKYLRLVDFDQVTLSSLNRHAVATLKDVGLPKATVLCNHLRQICPDESRLVLDPVVKMYTGDRERDGTMMDPPDGVKQWDVVIDAIDDVPTKANLIGFCAKRDIRVISCMGAGGKADPTRVHISDLRSASRDPLATAVRQRLRMLAKKEAKESGEKITNGSGVANGGWLSCVDDDSKLAVVFSSEKVVAKLAAITDEQKEEGMHNFGAVDNMRVRVLPVVGTMPAIMGQTLAAMALCELGGKPFSPVGAERVGRNVRHKLYQHLRSREKKLQDKLTPTLKEGSENYTTSGTYIGTIQIDPDDVEYLMAELWKNKCAVSGERLGTVLELYRWDMTRPATPNNLVLLSVKSAQKFEKDFEELGDGRKGVDDKNRARIEKRLSMCVLDAEDE
jgi:tRNA A37 threonylcarbamoyladenosine dehydratase